MIVGADGAIGRAVSAEFLASKVPILRTSRRRQASHQSDIFQLDLSSPASIAQLDVSQAASLIFCAGLTGYRECERKPAWSRKVNVVGLDLLTKKCSVAGIPITLISSSAVFSGEGLIMSEDTPVSPTSEYGEQKSDQEQIVLSERSGRVIRLTKVFPDNAGLLRSWATFLRRGQSIDAFSDWHVSPLSCKTVARFVVEDNRKELPGVRHLSPDGQLSYFELANRMRKFIGLSGEVRPVQTKGERDQPVCSFPNKTLLSCDAESSRQVSMHNELKKIFRDLIKELNTS